MGKSEYMGIDARRCADVGGEPMEDRPSNQSIIRWGKKV